MEWFHSPVELQFPVPELQALGMRLDSVPDEMMLLEGLSGPYG